VCVSGCLSVCLSTLTVPSVDATLKWRGMAGEWNVLHRRNNRDTLQCCKTSTVSMILPVDSLLCS
jgi:hypothetical protein